MRIRVVSTLVACGLLAGCSSGPGSNPATTPEPTAQEAPATADTPQAFHFESGTLEIGEFDPWTLGDDIFDPCTEITAEEFAAAGFGRVEQLPDELKGLTKGLAGCQIYDTSGNYIANLMNNNADRAHVVEQTEILSDHLSEVIPRLFTNGSHSGVGSDCFAQVDTNRGGLVIAVPGSSSSISQEETCRIAIELMEDLYLSTAP